MSEPGTTEHRRPTLGILGGAATRERHASALETFFDLVFVVAVAELAETLQHQPTLAGTARFCGLFLAVWWSWVGYTFFADRLDNDDDATHRIIMIVAMLAVASLAVAVPGAFDGGAGSVRFAASYVAVRILLMLMYARVHGYDATARPLTGRYLTGFAIGAAAWAASIAVPAPGRYWLWAAGLLVELTTPLAAGAAIVKVPFHVGHIPERFGLFVIIVLGEAVALDAIGISGERVAPAVLGVAAVGFLVVAAVWWLYFDCVDPAPMRRWRITGQAYTYGHAVVFGGITALGVGLLLAARSVAEHDLRSPARWAICAGAGAYLMAIGFIHLVDRRPSGDVRAWTRIGLGAAFLATAWAGRGLPVLVVEAVVLAGVSGQILLETRILRPTPGADPTGTAGPPRKPR